MLHTILIALLALTNVNTYQPRPWLGPDDYKITEGKVVGVTNGNTIKILLHERVYRVRLLYIDAPELKQAFGEKARQALSNKIFGKKVRIAWVKKDKFKRILGEVYYGKRFINGEMVTDGLAWYYKKHSKSKAIARLEKEARNANRGLWADKKPMPPWEFRRKKEQDKSISN